MSSSPSSVAEFAERILLTESLEDKLTAAPKSLVIDPPRRGNFTAPDLPGRPDHLIPKPNSGRSTFPSEQQIEDEEQRAILLHFFANHELLAVELMALALLKFPDAPDSFRRGVLRTLHEEQDHTRWYLERMGECGVEFGEHPLSPMIWSHISTMESPLDYVSRLSLTFEQANLDYAKHYSEVLAKAGDTRSSEIFGKIYRDEIAHVGHGVKWLRRWKENATSDWDAWHRQLHFPLSPIRAKGIAPFNAEGRKLAGLDDEFITKLKNFRASRGRSPDLYWFNPEVEELAANPDWKPTAAVSEIAADLEFAFALAAPTSDDLVLLRRQPREAHCISLAQHGLTFPETAPIDAIEKTRLTRKFRNERPWGINDREILSKASGLRLREIVDEKPIAAKICHSFEEASDFISSHDSDKWIAKPLLGAAGRGQKRFKNPNQLSWHGSVLIEELLNPELEFSLLYQVNRVDEGGIRFLGLSRQEVTKAGQWQASISSPKPTSGLDPEIARLIATEVLPFAKNEMIKGLEEFLAEKSYLGPLTIDCFLHRIGNTLHWQRVSELNARWSMGRLAHQLRLRLDPSRTTTLTTVGVHEFTGEPNVIALGDPSTAAKRIPILIQEPTNQRK